MTAFQPFIRRAACGDIMEMNDQRRPSAAIGRPELARRPMSQQVGQAVQ